MPLKFLTVAAAAVLSTAAFAGAGSPESPSSEIPDRREFLANEKINPCENFYEHACSRVISSFKLRDDRSSHIFSFSDSRERLLEKKRRFLQELQQKRYAQATLSPRSQTLATVYGACMDGQSRALEERRYVETTVAQVMAIKDRHAFLDFLATQRDTSHHAFVSVDSTPNKDRADFNDFIFFTDLKSLPERSYYLDAKTAEDFRAVVEAFFVTIGDRQAKETAKAVVAFETNYAQQHPLPAKMREIWAMKSSISKADIAKKYPSFRLDAPLQRVPSHTNILHIIPETFAFVENKLQTENLQTLKAVYLYQALANLMDDGYPDFFNKRFAFNQAHLGGPQVRPERAERCTEMVMNDFDRELDAEVLPLVFPNFPEEKFIALAEKVRAAIVAGVESNQWLSVEGKKGAIDKVARAKLQLVKPRTESEWYFNPVAVYTPHEPLENTVRLNRVLTDRMFAELDQLRDRDRWSMGPLTVNAYYSPSDNKFVMPVGILQYPFYDPSLPDEMNLGAVGVVIGHELGHGIDDEGAKYDATGALKQWMTAADIKRFQERGRKFVEQFNQIGHDGELTLGENIGDLTGITFAYHAAFPSGQGDQAQKKNFFLQHARLWCGVERPEYAKMQLKTNPHARGWARVNQQMKNQPEFAKAFACQSKDAMVLPPQSVVKIW